MSPDATDIQTLFTYTPFAVYALLFPLFILSNSFTRRFALFLTLFFAVACGKYLGYLHLGGAVFVPNLPDKVIWAWDYAFLFSMTLFAMLVAFLPVSFIVMKLDFHMPRCVRAQLIPIAAAVLAGIMQYNALALPDVHEVEYISPDLPAFLDGYKIVQLSDLHVSSAAKRWRTEKVVELANQQGADLIVVTGDIVDGLPDELADDVEPLRKLQARNGVFYCCGNHEFYFDWYAWKAKYDEWGMTFLRNECVEPVPGLTLAGIDDQQVELIDDPEPSVVQAFSEAKDGTFRILLKHRPGAPAVAAAKPKKAKQDLKSKSKKKGKDTALEQRPREKGLYDLQLSGHTHGGVAPGLKEFIALKNDGYVKGLYEKSSHGLYVHPGSGQWPAFEIRLFNPSEIAVITLKIPRGN